MDSQIYGQQGRHNPAKRMHWLWDWFSHNNLPHLTKLLQPLPQYFAMEVFWLTHINITYVPRKPKVIHRTNQHHTLNPEITKIPIDSYKITHSYYSSPSHTPHNSLNKAYLTIGTPYSDVWGTPNSLNVMELYIEYKWLPKKAPLQQPFYFSATIMDQHNNSPSTSMPISTH